ncbi:hypothetical protein CHRY9390_01926 [Chryseobacterium aquaeductus]|uniref:DUF1648 domain-containing protein n=1 Tax=Chryseobacterium aquaeductus TaxID=2675056 RepID=A0A9N8MG84_9FLAO|nr:DUF1648 domain-containing protein [Chryseobacterium aquaeductus]CAA7331239.1 hypothetical protein CHRY9390_01926 [Chryseobacterium potabilaquae]CAD7809012.1 hypothetical protein CHRY9390_01926 [Chryseobacterium aquaeductus]
MENILFLAFDVINFTLLIVLWWITVKNYKKLPAVVPTHFDVEGKADRFGNKKWMFLMPLFGVITYLFFLIVLNYPESVNFPVEITDENKDHQISIMTFFMKWLLTLVLIIFLNNQDYMIRYSFNEKAKTRIPFWLPLLLIFLSLIATIISASVFK